MFKLESLISKSYQEFGEMLEASGEDLYQKIMMALKVDTDKELARVLGISEQAVNNAKRSGKIPDRWLMYAVCVSGIALPLLVSLSGRELERALADSDKFSFRLVPVVKTLQYAAGDDYENHIESYVAVQKSALLKDDATEDELIAARVRGYSLEPTISRSDVMIISLTQKEFIPGGIFIVSIDETRLPCRLHKVPGRYRILFDNPALESFDVEKVDIYGRVLMTMRRH